MWTNNHFLTVKLNAANKLNNESINITNNAMNNLTNINLNDTAKIEPDRPIDLRKLQKSSLRSKPIFQDSKIKRGKQADLCFGYAQQPNRSLSEAMH